MEPNNPDPKVLNIPIRLIGGIFFVCLAGFCLTVAGLITDSWYVYYYAGRVRIQEGMWKRYFLGVERDQTDAVTVTARAFVIMGILFGVVCCILLIIFMDSRKTKMVRMLSAMSSFLAGILILIGVFIFDTYFNPDYSYSFFLALFGGLFYLVTGILVLVDMRLTNYSRIPNKCSQSQEIVHIAFT
ncbi:hypothetical protein SNE40_009027 [Patella caerulea]|uniref:Uncharacterized protein n=1 Tax=Patella caerulea TaxID=87958 RepID=A0AAN8Q2I2_PATCE